MIDVLILWNVVVAIVVFGLFFSFVTVLSVSLIETEITKDSSHFSSTFLLCTVPIKFI